MEQQVPSTPAPPQAPGSEPQAPPAASPSNAPPVAPAPGGDLNPTQAAPPPPPAPPSAAGPAVTTMPAQAAEAAPAEEKILPQDWPKRGYSGPQAWEATNPPEITHNQRLITSGTHGPEVIELCALLARLGLSTPISQGLNPHAIYETATAAAVRQFCTEYGVSEDPTIVSAMSEDVVGPWLWEALFRAVHKAGQEQ